MVHPDTGSQAKQASARDGCEKDENAKQKSEKPPELAFLPDS